MQKRWLTTSAGAVLAALVLSACGGGGETPPPGGSGEETQAEHNFTLAVEGHLTVGSDIPYPPFEFEKDGVLTGFDVDLLREIAERIGLENTDDDWQSVDFGTIFQQLQTANKFDVIVAAVTAYATEGSPAAEVVAERVKRVDFTLPYYDSLQSLTVDTSANPDIKGVDDLPDGAKVAVQRATTGAFYAEETLTNAELVTFAQSPPMYQALQGGSVVAVINDLPVSIESVKGKPDLVVVEQLETGEQYGIGVNKENPELKDAIDEALQAMFDDGTYAEIFRKYFPKQEMPSYATE